MYPRCKKFINAWATVRSLMLLLTNWPALNSLHCTRDLEESLKTKYKGWVHIWHENFLGVTIKIKKLLKSLNYFFPFFPSVGNHFCGISNCRTLKIFFKISYHTLSSLAFYPPTFCPGSLSKKYCICYSKVQPLKFLLKRATVVFLDGGYPKLLQRLLANQRAIARRIYRICSHP